MVAVLTEVDLTGNTQLTLSAGLRDLEGTPFFGLPTSAQGVLQPYPRSSFIGAAFNRSDQRGSEYTIGLLQSFGDDWLLNAEIRHADERFVQMRFDATSAPNPAGLSTFRHRGSDLEGLRTAGDMYPQTTTSVRGDTLPPVTGTQYEAGVKAILAAGRLRASAALFHLTEENRSQADPLNPGFSIPVGEIRSRGFEAEISGEPLAGLRLTAGYAYTDAIVVRAEVVGPEVPSLNGKRVANTPLHSIRGSMGYDFQTPALAAFSAGMGIQSGSEIANLAPLNVIHQGGFTVLSAQLGYRINEVTNASLIVNNLTDKRYYQSLSTTTSGNYYGDPRNLQFVVRARF